MDNLLKLKFEELSSAFEDYKRTNKELIEAELKGKVDPLLSEKHSQIDTRMNDLEDEITKLKTYNGFEAATDAGVSSKDGHLYADYFRHGRDGMESTELERLKSASHDYRQKAMVSGTDADGGFTLSPDFSARILSAIKERSPMREYCDITTISSDTWKDVYDNSDVGYGWVAETDARNETTTPTLNEISISVGELYAQPKISQQLLDDSAVNIESYLEDKIADRFARAEGASIISGDGISKPKGFLTYSAGTSFNEIEQLSSQISLGISYEGLVELTDALAEDYQQDAIFVVKRQTKTLLRKLVDGDNRPLWEPNVQNGLPATLLGFPLVTAPDMPSVAASALSVAFGNFKRGYKLIDRAGMRILRDPYTEKGYVKFYATRRLGGAVQDFKAIKLMAIDA